jgi:hypothetical protein
MSVLFLITKQTIGHLLYVSICLIHFRIKNSGHPWHNKTKIWIDQDVDSIKVNGLSPGHIYEYTLCIVINGDAVCNLIVIKELTTGSVG